MTTKTIPIHSGAAPGARSWPSINRPSPSNTTSDAQRSGAEAGGVSSMRPAKRCSVRSPRVSVPS